MGKKAVKYSISEVESLIKSIRDIHPNITEEAICKAINYAPGYISQLRSRENEDGQPRVSQKFLDRLRLYIATLQNANQPKGIESNLKAIAKSLALLHNDQTLLRAEVRAYGQYQIQQEVGWDQKKFLSAMAKVGMLIGANLEGDDLKGSNGRGHK